MFHIILKEIMDQDENNSEVVATLADMYAHKGDLDNALDIVNTSVHKDSNSLIIKLIKLKLLSLNGEFNVSKGLDDIIHFLVTDEGYHKYKNTPPDKDIVWIYENSDENKLYPQILEIIDYTIVTSDSVNMISEVATLSKPLFISHFSKENKKISFFISNLKELNIVKDYEGDLFKFEKNKLRTNKISILQVNKFFGFK